ncbi:MAG TPA: cupredoxin family copper-binding protein [Candidatus Acidoferrales bacterium]|jgi:plastocyanin
MKTAISKLIVATAMLGALGWISASNARFGVSAASAQGAAKSQEVVVKIDNFSYMPHDITVAAGTTVIWVNNDDIPHTVVSTTDAFKSKALDTDDKFSFKFDKPGTYEYFCSIHPKMTAKVIVQ